MKQVLSIALALFVVSVRSAPANSGYSFEWPFYQDGNEMFVDLKVGTPAQTVKVSLRYFNTNEDLQILSSKNGGDFNERDSKTYVASYQYDRPGKVVGNFGYENFLIGNSKYSLENASFVLRNESDGAYKAQMGFSVPFTDQNSFLLKLIYQLPSPIFTVAYTNYPIKGLFTFGKLDTDHCYSDWKVFKDFRWSGIGSLFNYEKWGIKLDRISAGKYSYLQPGKVQFTLNNELTRWPKSVYQGVIKALGSIDGKYVKCDVKEVISFQIEDLTIDLTPDVYLDKEQEKSKGLCTLAGETVDNSDEFLLPRAVLKNYCLFYDQQNWEIGLAQRK